MPAAAIVPTMQNQARKARHAARKSAGRFLLLVPDSTHAGTTPHTQTNAATYAIGCCDGNTAASMPSAGTPSKIHQIPAVWVRNRIRTMGASI